MTLITTDEIMIIYHMTSSRSKWTIIVIITTTVLLTNEINKLCLCHTLPNLENTNPFHTLIKWFVLLIIDFCALRLHSMY